MFVYFSSLKGGILGKNLDMKKFAFLSDVFFSFFVSFFFTVFLFRYLKVSLIPSLLLACVCGVLTAGAIYTLLKAKRKTLYLKKSDEQQMEKLLLHLALLSDERKTRLLSQALSDEENAACPFGKLRLFTKTEFYFLKFSLAPIYPDDILPLSRFKTGKRKILLCSQIDKSAQLLCNRLDIKVETGEQVYKRLKERDLLPSEYLGDTPSKERRPIKLWFSKHNAKRFLVSGALVLLVSRLTTFYYYYLLFGVLLLLSSVLVRIFGYE